MTNLKQICCNMKRKKKVASSGYRYRFGWCFGLKFSIELMSSCQIIWVPSLIFNREERMACSQAPSLVG